MRYSAVTFLFVITVVVVPIKAQTGTCGGDCSQSDSCAIEAQDFNCRCSYFHCKVIPEGECGGGCLTNSQCSRWANGDEGCVCGSLFECINKSELKKPGYMTYAKFIAATKEALRKKVEGLKKLQLQEKQE